MKRSSKYMHKVLVVDDHACMREGLCSLIQKEGSFEIVGDVGDGQKALELFKEKKPDVVVMDIFMPNMNGIEATRQMKNIDPTVKILILTMHTEKEFINQAMLAGANGYLSKQCAYEEINTAIRTLVNNQAYLSSQVATVLVSDYVQAKKNGNDSSSLSERETSVLKMISEGMRTKDIAAELGIGAKSIEVCRSQIMRKLNIYTIAELTKYAIHHGLTSLDV